MFFLSVFLITFTSCNKANKDFAKDANRPIQAEDKRRKNINEGRGVSIGSLAGRVSGGTTYEFSSSNPMWRASLETLDFLPLATVDYSGGMIITDWYADDSDKFKSLKITVRFLSNEVRTDSLKIIIHQKICKTSGACSTNLLEES